MNADLFLFTFETEKALEQWRKEQKFPLAEYSITRREYRFPSGSRFLLRVVNSPDDVAHLGGLRFTGLFLHQEIDPDFATALRYYERY